MVTVTAALPAVFSTAELVSDQFRQLAFGQREAGAGDQRVAADHHPGVGARGQRRLPDFAAFGGVEGVDHAVGGGSKDNIIGDQQRAVSGLRQFRLPDDLAGREVERHDFPGGGAFFAGFFAVDQRRRVVDDRHVDPPAVGRGESDGAAERAREHLAGLDLVVFAAHRQHVVFVVTVVLADAGPPDRLAGLDVHSDDESGLARPNRHFLAAGLGDDRRVLEVPVVDVVRRLLVVPDELAGLGIEFDQRVGVEVRARPAGAERFAFGAGERRRVTGAGVDEALGVEGGRVPEAAAGVHLRFAPEAFRHRVPVPQFLARLAVHHPERPDLAGFVFGRRRLRHGRDVDLAVVDARRHIDRAAEFHLPDVLAGFLVERKGFRGGGAVDVPVGDGQPVRAMARRFVLLRPEDVAAFEVDRLDIGFKVLGVDDAARDHRGRGVAAVDTGAVDRVRPDFFQFGDVAAVDRALHRPRAGKIDVGDGVAGEAGVAR